MSSIPLPALAVKPPEQQDPVGQYAKGIALQGLLANQQQQQQMRPLELQQAQGAIQKQQVDAQQQQQQLQDKQILNKLWLSNGGDITKVQEQLPKSGISVDGAAQWQKQMATMGEQVSKMDKEHFDATKAANAQLGPIAQSIVDAPTEDQAALYALNVNKIKRDPTLAKYATDLPPTYPGPDFLKQHIAMMKTFEELSKDKESAASIGPLGDKVGQLNQGLEQRWQVLHPNTTAPKWAQLSPDATPKDFDRVDKLLQQSENAYGTKAQQETTNAIRQQTAQLASQAAADRHAAAQEKANKPTADEQRRADLAQNLNENMDQLEDILTRRPELFGKWGGRATGAKAWIGTDDPDIAALETIKHQVGIAQISAHGMRSARGIEAAAGSVLNDFHNSPEATMNSLQAVRNSVRTFTQNAEGDKAGPQNKQTTKPPPGATHIVPGKDGQNHYTNAAGTVDLGVAP